MCVHAGESVVIVMNISIHGETLAIQFEDLSLSSFDIFQPLRPQLPPAYS